MVGQYLSVPLIRNGQCVTLAFNGDQMVDFDVTRF